MTKRSGFRESEKRLNKHSKEAAKTMRALYTDAALKKDFKSIEELISEEILGSQEIRENVRARVFPDKTVGFGLENMADDEERRNAYQEAGAELGRRGVNVVIVFSVSGYRTIKTEKEFMEISGVTPDGREIWQCYQVMRDSGGVIQNLVAIDDEPRTSQGQGSNVFLASLIVGYAMALRDKVLGGVLNNS